MSNQFRNKYRIPSARLQTWDYGWNAAYFITICTKNMEFFFGNIDNGVMHLSGAGIIANILWHEIKNHATGIELGEFIVMPNHMHGIIILKGNNSVNDSIGGIGYNDNNDNGKSNVEKGHAVSLRQLQQESLQPDNAQTGHALSLRQSMPPLTPGQKRFRNQGKNTVSSIVGGYKSAVSKHANRLKFNCTWQTRFHDHIIRDQQSFLHISNYIINNAANWPDDKFFKLPLDTQVLPTTP